MSKFCQNFHEKIEKMLEKAFPKLRLSVTVDADGVLRRREREKNVEFVDLVKSFPTLIWSRRSASIQRRTDRSKFEIEKLTHFDEYSSSVCDE